VFAAAAAAVFSASGAWGQYTLNVAGGNGSNNQVWQTAAWSGGPNAYPGAPGSFGGDTATINSTDNTGFTTSVNSTNAPLQITTLNLGTVSNYQSLNLAGTGGTQVLQVDTINVDPGASHQGYYNVYNSLNVQNNDPTTLTITNNSTQGTGIEFQQGATITASYGFEFYSTQNNDNNYFQTDGVNNLAVSSLTIGRGTFQTSPYSGGYQSQTISGDLTFNTDGSAGGWSTLALQGAYQTLNVANININRSQVRFSANLNNPSQLNASGNLNLNNGGGAVTFNLPGGPVNVSGGITAAGAETLTLSGSSLGSLTIGGTSTLGSSNAINVNGPTLNVSGTLGTAPVNLNSGNLELSTPYANAFGAGKATLNWSSSGGTVELGVDHAWDHAFSLSAGQGLNVLAPQSNWGTGAGQLSASIPANATLAGNLTGATYGVGGSVQLSPGAFVAVTANPPTVAQVGNGTMAALILSDSQSVSLGSGSIFGKVVFNSNYGTPTGSFLGSLTETTPGGGFNIELDNAIEFDSGGSAASLNATGPVIVSGTGQFNLGVDGGGNYSGLHDSSGNLLVRFQGTAGQSNTTLANLGTGWQPNNLITSGQTYQVSSGVLQFGNNGNGAGSGRNSLVAGGTLEALPGGTLQQTDGNNPDTGAGTIKIDSGGALYLGSYNSGEVLDNLQALTVASGGFLEFAEGSTLNLTAGNTLATAAAGPGIGIIGTSNLPLHGGNLILGNGSYVAGPDGWYVQVSNYGSETNSITTAPGNTIGFDNASSGFNPTRIKVNVVATGANIVVNGDAVTTVSRGAAGRGSYPQAANYSQYGYNFVEFYNPVTAATFDVHAGQAVITSTGSLTLSDALTTVNGDTGAAVVLNGAFSATNGVRWGGTGTLSGDAVNPNNGSNVNLNFPIHVLSTGILSFAYGGDGSVNNGQGTANFNNLILDGGATFNYSSGYTANNFNASSITLGGSATTTSTLSFPGDQGALQNRSIGTVSGSGIVTISSGNFDRNAVVFAGQINSGATVHYIGSNAGGSSNEYTVNELASTFELNGGTLSVDTGANFTLLDTAVVQTGTLIGNAGFNMDGRQRLHIQYGENGKSWGSGLTIQPAGGNPIDIYANSGGTIVNEFAGITKVAAGDTGTINAQADTVTSGSYGTVQLDNIQVGAGGALSLETAQNGGPGSTYVNSNGSGSFTGGVLTGTLIKAGFTVLPGTATVLVNKNNSSSPYEFDNFNSSGGGGTLLIHEYGGGGGGTPVYFNGQINTGAAVHYGAIGTDARIFYPLEGNNFQLNGGSFYLDSNAAVTLADSSLTHTGLLVAENDLNADTREQLSIAYNENGDKSPWGNQSGGLTIQAAHSSNVNFYANNNGGTVNEFAGVTKVAALDTGTFSAYPDPASSATGTYGTVKLDNVQLGAGSTLGINAQDNGTAGAGTHLELGGVFLPGAGNIAYLHPEDIPGQYHYGRASYVVDNVNGPGTLSVVGQENSVTYNGTVAAGARLAFNQLNSSNGFGLGGGLAATLGSGFVLNGTLEANDDGSTTNSYIQAYALGSTGLLMGTGSSLGGTASLRGADVVTTSNNTLYSAGTFTLANEYPTGGHLIVNGAGNQISTGTIVALGATINSSAALAIKNTAALSVNSLTNNGLINVQTGGRLIINSPDSGTAGTVYGALNTQLQTSFNAGWNVASGIASSTSAGSSLYGLGDTINGNTVTVMGTYYGDTNLDGQVTSVDYTNIDNGYLSHLTGWQNGDFNYDGVVNGSDYTLIDNAFNTQGAQLSSEIASPSAQIGSSAGASSVPEPATLGLLAMGATGLLGRRRSR
jgi:hypothetical protein